MKLGVIGCGFMATAIMKGIITRNIIKPTDIIAADRHDYNLERIKANFGSEVTSDNKLAASQDVVLIAVQPWCVPDLMAEIREVVIANDTIIWTLAAGVTIEQIKSYIGENVKVIRSMPNTCAQVGTSVTGVSPGKNMSEDDISAVMKLIEGFGIAEILSEEKLDSIVPVTGSSPAMIFMLIDAMANSAVREGFTWEQAIKFSAQTVKGCAEMVLESGLHPAELQNQVCTPGGITIEMIKRLEKYGFRNAVMEGMQACTENLK